MVVADDSPEFSAFKTEEKKKKKRKKDHNKVSEPSSAAFPYIIKSLLHSPEEGITCLPEHFQVVKKGRDNYFQFKKLHF